MPNPRWEHFEHQADMGVRGYGNTPAMAFEQAALAMTAISTDPASVNTEETVDIVCEEPEMELLLVDWLNALIYQTATRNMLFREFHVDINNGRLTAQAKGEKIDVPRHQPAVEVKGATYTALAVYEQQGQWVAQCVVDV